MGRVEAPRANGRSHAKVQARVYILEEYRDIMFGVAGGGDEDWESQNLP